MVNSLAMAKNMNNSSDSIERERSWVIDLENKLASNNAAELFEEEIQWSKPCIFRSPGFLGKLKKDVFTPQVVAIGPYHHHEIQLQPFESHKERALHNFLKRGVTFLDVYVRVMISVVEELRGSYDDMDEKWKNQDNFIRLMITDGCFMLEVMRLNPQHCKNYAPSDPFFGFSARMKKVPYIRRDMLILENQLPLLVFKKLLSVENDVDENEAERMITKLMVRFFSPSLYNDENSLAEFTDTIHAFHALNIYRRSMLFIPTKAWQFPTSKMAQTRYFAMMRSGTRLRAAGITFRKADDSFALNAISFNSKNGILTLPRITVDDSTEYEFLNMVALEHLHAQCNNDISSYVDFMATLVDSAEDVHLLHYHGLVNNELGSDKDFANLFNSMSKEVIVEQGGSLGWVQKEVEMYCNKRWNHWRANLTIVYFRDPWSSICAFNASLILLLTFLSLVFSIFQWKNGSGK